MEMELADKWVSSEQVSSDDLLIWPGDFLAALTRHRIRSTVHRIPAREKMRFSSPVLVRIDPDAMLTQACVEGTGLLQPGDVLHGRDLRQFVEAKRKLVS